MSLAKPMARQFCRRIAATLLAFVAVVLPLVGRAEKANVVFIHCANVSEQDDRAWAVEMGKRQVQCLCNVRSSASDRRG